MAKEKGIVKEGEVSLISEKTRSMVGRELNIYSPEFSEEFVGPQDFELRESIEVTKQDLKRFTDVIGDPNPMWETIAPPTFILNFDFVHYMVEMLLSMRNMEVIKLGFNGGQELEFYVPIRMGDVITYTGKVLSAEEKTTRRGDKLALTVFEVYYTNQRGELAAKYKMTLVDMATLYPKHDEDALPRPRPLAEEMLKATLLKRGLLEVVKRKQLNYCDVNVGDEIPSLVQPVTSRRLIRWAEISHDQHEWHYDFDIAHEVWGMPRVIVNGALVLTFLGRLMTDYIGEKGILKNFGATYRHPQYLGDDVTCKGKVVNKYVKDVEHCIELEFWAQNPRETICIIGEAIAILPE
ncbi:MaoC family dehydratase N-terminal domain-containing protein [Chloroflexota bacterium]